MFESELKFCVNYKYDYDYKGKIHGHPCYELVYYAKGKGIVEINNAKYTFSPNTFCLIEPNFFHLEEGIKGTEVIYIGFLVENKNNILESGLYRDNNGEILELMKCIHHEMQLKPKYNSRMMNILTEIVVLKFIRKFDKVAEESQNDMDYVINFIKLNCMKNLNVKDLAKSISYSYDYFRHKFAEKVGMTAKEYIMQERFRYAKDMLINSKYSIKEVAYMSGYNSPSHFCVIFKKQMGITPNEFIEKVKKEMIHTEIIIKKD